MNHANTITSEWARIGAAFGAKPSDQTPDLERLLLDTARHLSQNARLFTMSLSWLSQYGDTLIAKHRLRHLIQHELEDDYHPIIGLLLDTLKSHTGTRHFNMAIQACRPARESMPLFEIERASEVLRKRSRKRATQLSKDWNLWAPPQQIKHDAIRPASWIIDKNPSLSFRASMKGDLRTTILIVLREIPDAGDSELALARNCTATRAAVRDALEDLELSGHITRRASGRKNTIELRRRGRAA